MFAPPARIATALGCIVGLLLLAFASAQEGADSRYARQLKEEMQALPGTPVVVIDGSALDQFHRQVEPGVGTSALVAVDGQPFSKAVRVEVLQAVYPRWRAQVITPASNAAVRKGDTLLLVYFARDTQSHPGTDGAMAAASLQLPRAPWTSFGSFSLKPGKDWQKYYRHFQAEQDIPAGDLSLAFHFGQRAQTMELGGLVLLNLGQNVDAAKLPFSKITYAGREPDAPWRAAAQERIERLRKADFAVEVTNGSGKPIPNAAIHVKMLRHAYQFGTFLERPALWENADGQKYRETVQRLFNRVTVPLYWADWGWDDPETRTTYLKLAGWAHEAGMHIRGHNLIWPSWKYTPTWLRQFEKDPRRLRNVINASIAERVATFRPFAFDDYDVINELRYNHAIVDILGDDEPAQWFKLAHTLDPGPKLGINEYDIISGGGHTETEQAIYEGHIRQLQGSGAPLGVIGVQCHIGEEMTPPQDVVAILDRFSKFGLPIQATEFDVNVEDEAAQADYMRDFLTAFFSHPATEAITQWGFWEGRHWIPRAALFRKDWSLKPNGKAFTDLVFKAWWTDANGATGPDGRYQTRGFLGDYEVEVKVDGVTKRLPAKVARGGSLLKVRWDK